MSYFVVTRVFDSFATGPRVRYLSSKGRMQGKLQKARKFATREQAQTAAVGLESVIEIIDTEDTPQ